MPTTNRYATVIIKPDAHKDILVQMILDDFENGGLEIVLRKDMALSREQAEMIYRGEAGKETHSYAIKSLLRREGRLYTTMAIVKSAGGSSALTIARKIRGKSGQSGIRSKYQLHTKEELKEKYQLEGEFRMALAENRVHVPDTDSEAMEIINVLTTQREKEDLREREPELYRELKKYPDLREQKTELSGDRKKRLN